MTFDAGAYAINGAEISAALARRALYAEARYGGVVKKGDLKVSQLAVPGVGVLISEGVGLVLNDYQDDPNETYVVSNPGTHTIPEIEMPAASPSAKSYILAVVVGDPDFDQAGHPWMGADDPAPGEETTFQYVRPTLIEVSAGATSLNASYPALPLARIDVPPNTTTITNTMITDLRHLASPRSEQTIQVSPADTWTNADPRYIGPDGDWRDWGVVDYAPWVTIPSWASRAIVVASVNGIRISDLSQNISGDVRVMLDEVPGNRTKYDFETQANNGVVRENMQCASEYDVSAIAGQTVRLRVSARQNAPASPTWDQRPRLQAGSQMIFDVRFFEE